MIYGQWSNPLFLQVRGLLEEQEHWRRTYFPSEFLPIATVLLTTTFFITVIVLLSFFLES